MYISYFISYYIIPSYSDCIYLFICLFFYVYFFPVSLTCINTLFMYLFLYGFINHFQKASAIVWVITLKVDLWEVLMS